MLLTARKRSIFFVEAAYRADHLLHCKGDKNACYENKHWDKKHLKSWDMFPYWETNIWSLGRCCPTDWADTCFDPITRIFAILWNAGVLSADWEDICNGSDGEMGGWMDGCTFSLGHHASWSVRSRPLTVLKVTKTEVFRCRKPNQSSQSEASKKNIARRLLPWLLRFTSDDRSLISANTNYWWGVMQETLKFAERDLR